MGRYGERVAEVCRTAYGRDVLPAAPLAWLVFNDQIRRKKEAQTVLLVGLRR